jgi:hypothetical protein
MGKDRRFVKNGPCTCNYALNKGLELPCPVHGNPFSNHEPEPETELSPEAIFEDFLREKGIDPAQIVCYHYSENEAGEPPNDGIDIDLLELVGEFLIKKEKNA